MVSGTFFTEDRGYDKIGRDAIYAFEKESKQNRFWADVGTPVEYSSPFGLN